MNSNTRWVNQSNFHLNGNNNFGKIQPFKDENLLEKELTKIGL